MSENSMDLKVSIIEEKKHYVCVFIVSPEHKYAYTAITSFTPDVLFVVEGTIRLCVISLLYLSTGSPVTQQLQDQFTLALFVFM